MYFSYIFQTRHILYLFLYRYQWEKMSKIPVRGFLTPVHFKLWHWNDKCNKRDVVTLNEISYKLSTKVYISLTLILGSGNGLSLLGKMWYHLHNFWGRGLASWDLSFFSRNGALAVIREKGKRRAIFGWILLSWCNIR